MDTYLVAVKRQHRHRAKDDWAAVLGDIDGVETAPDPLRPDRIQIKATPSGLAKVRECLGDLCHVEALLRHDVAAAVPDADTTPPVGPPQPTTEDPSA